MRASTTPTCTCTQFQPSRVPPRGILAARSQPPRLPSKQEVRPAKAARADAAEQSLSGLANPERAARPDVAAVDLGIKGVYRHVTVITTPVTLTARSGKIPITVANGSAERVTVVLRLTSPKVDLPGTSEPFVLEPHRRTTQLLQVGTRATGSFPIRVDVLTPDGEVTIAGSDIRLTSTAFNRVALALTGGAVGVLLLWWRFGRRRNGTDR
jgi:hypothetical protein